MRGGRPVLAPRPKRIMAGARPCRRRGHGTARVCSREPSSRYQDASLGELAMHDELLLEMWIDLARETEPPSGAWPRRTRLLGPIQDGRFVGPSLRGYPETLLGKKVDLLDS